MSPLDDELRATLAGRAARLAPAPDPMAGIEARAGRIRRNRTTGALAGTALAVVLVAVGVPVALGGATTGTAPSTFAVPTPGPVPATTPPGPATVPSALFDPLAPWPYRGEQDVVTAANVEAVAALWQRRHAGSRVTPLYGQVDAASGQQLLVVAATGTDGGRWGLVRFVETGPELLLDEAVRDEQAAFVAALDGDRTDRLLVVAAPSSERIAYSPDGTTEVDMSPLADGVAGHPLEGDPAADSVRVYAPGGERVYRQAAPSVPAPVRTAPSPSVTPRSSPPAAEPSQPPAPTQPSPAALAWPERGTAPSQADTEQARLAYATAFDRAGEVAQVQLQVLVAGDFDGGSRTLFAQAWLPGQRVHVLGWTWHAGSAPEVHVGPPVEAGAAVLALLVRDLPGSSVDTLVVVPQPGTGQVLYGADDATEYAPAADLPGGDGVVLVDRAEDATTDRLRLLDGDGDLDRPTFDGPVADLLCGVDGCR